MDSSAYRHFILESLAVPLGVRTCLPLRDIAAGAQIDKVTMAGLRRFLVEVADAADQSTGRPALLSAFRSQFAGVFSHAHRAIGQALEAGDSGTHPFRATASELVVLLSMTVGPRTTWAIPSHQSSDLAMACFLLEACMHLGWCPSAQEGFAKRAAHLYFAFMKKAAPLATGEEESTILDYMAGALVLAQTTEGIEEQRLPAESGPVRRTLTLRIDGTSLVCPLYHAPRPPLCCVLPVSAERIPHPIMHLESEGSAGLRLFCGGEAVTPAECLDSGEITRPGMWGHRVTYRCLVPSHGELRWTVAVLVRESTIYRIDTLSTPHRVEVDGAEVRLENSNPLTGSSGRFLGGPTSERVVVDFVDYPFPVTYEREDAGHSLFRGRQRFVVATTPVRLVAAWARGHGLTAINRTELLGLYG